MKKKGVVTIQFNWIYVLIVGSLILAMFIGVVMRQKAASERASAGDLQRRLDTMFAGAISSPGTFRTNDIGIATLNFDCSGFKVGSELGGFSPGVSFAPSSMNLKGRSLITWALNWHVPFKVASFLYVTSKHVRYIIIGDNPLVEQLKKKLPEDLNILYVDDFQDAKDVEYENEDKTRFIVVGEGGNLDLHSSFRAREVSALWVINDGTIQFYRKYPGNLELNTVGSPMAYIGEADLYGAIFSDDAEAYKCGIEDAYKRLNLITRVYISRTEKLKQAYPQGSDCFAIYDNPEGPLKTLSNIASSAGTMSSASVKANLGTLGGQNRALQIYSCPLIY